MRGASATAAGSLTALVTQTLGRDVVSVTTQPLRYATTHAMTEIDVALADGSSRTLVYKDLATDRRLAQAQGLRPPFLDDASREVHVYRSVLAGKVPGVAQCLASEADDRTGAWWLLLERVPGVELWQIGELEVWCDVARWAAALHERPGPADPVVCTRLVTYDRTFFEHWPRRARQFAKDWEPTRRRRLGEALESYDQTLDALAGMPRCLVHGELYPSNVLVDRVSGRISAVDWEMAGVGPPLLDLSTLVGGGWSQTERHAIITAYHSSLPPSLRPSSDRLLEDLMHCELHRCIQWLGWAPGWQSPVEHRHDWLETAVSLAQCLRGG